MDVSQSTSSKHSQSAVGHKKNDCIDRDLLCSVRSFLLVDLSNVVEISKYRCFLFNSISIFFYNLALKTYLQRYFPSNEIALKYLVSSTFIAQLPTTNFTITGLFITLSFNYRYYSLCLSFNTKTMLYIQKNVVLELRSKKSVRCLKPIAIQCRTTAGRLRIRQKLQWLILIKHL